MAEASRRPARRPRGEVAEGKEQRTSDEESAQGDTEPMKSSKEGRTDTSATLQPLTEATADDWLGSNDDPDVMLSVPNLGIDHIGIKVENIRAHVELHAKVLDLLELHVGAQVSIEEVEIEIENTRVQAMLKVNLKEVSKIVDRLLTSIDNNPEILTNLTGGIGKGVENALSGGTNTEQDNQDDQNGQESDDSGGAPPPRG